ncbi:hypothetical protein GCM10010916_26240 [Paenibacillus abyssi]|uniref:Uncharacterized protein n=1 Tax=Paenibacillus abyssi TaxID=1340531 RepID=A0A917D3C4_9BACL|nr:hypothetical protein GCM10010916_26240 [Paenibacillus abyssi]
MQVSTVIGDAAYSEKDYLTYAKKNEIELVAKLNPLIIGLPAVLMILLHQRLEASGEQGGSIYTSEPSVYAGDFASPEQIIPPEGVTDDNGSPIPWEAVSRSTTIGGMLPRTAGCKVYSNERSARRTIKASASALGTTTMS